MSACKKSIFLPPQSCKTKMGALSLWLRHQYDLQNQGQASLSPEQLRGVRTDIILFTDWRHPKLFEADVRCVSRLSARIQLLLNYCHLKNNWSPFTISQQWKCTSAGAWVFRCARGKLMFCKIVAVRHQNASALLTGANKQPFISWHIFNFRAMWIESLPSKHVVFWDEHLGQKEERPKQNVNPEWQMLTSPKSHQWWTCDEDEWDLSS